MALKRHPSLYIHPGIMLKEMIFQPDNITIVDAAKSLKIARHHLSNIVNGKNGITPNMAIRISIVFGGSAEFWNNLQKDYDLFRAELDFEEELVAYSSDDYK